MLLVVLRTAPLTIIMLKLMDLARLGLIAEHGYWVKPAAAHRSRHSGRARGSTGWDEAVGSGTPPSQFSDIGDRDAEGGRRDSRFRDSRGSGTGTPSGKHESTAHKHHGHRRSTVTSGDGPPSPDDSSRQQPNEGGRPSGSGSGWILRSHNADLSWRSEVLAILENFTGRTPGSFLELKDR